MQRTKLLVFVAVVATLLGTISSVFAQGATLTIWADDTRAPVIQGFAEQVEADLGITLDVVQLGLGDIRDQLLVAGPVGEGPDIIISPHDVVGQLVANGAIVPIELGSKAEDFQQSTLDLFTYQETLYGVPYAIENIALIRNTDLVPEAPQTWEEILSLSEQFQAEDTAEYAFVLKTNDFYHTYPVITAFGGYVFGIDEGVYNPADIGLANDGAFASAEWLSDMWTNGYMPTDVSNDVMFQLWEDGDAGMFVTGPWFSQRITDAAADGGFNYSIDALPGSEMGMDTGSPFAGGQGFLISAFSENQLLAEIFLLDYVATDEFMQALFDNDPRPPAFLSVDTSSDQNLSAFVAAGNSAIPQPAIPEMNAVWAAANNALVLTSQGEDPIASFQTAVAQINEAIDLQSSDARIVSLPGSLNDEMGCDTDWNPACELAEMADQGDGIYTVTVTLPAGDYEYKVAINKAWDENYGVDGELDGGNYTLSLTEETEITFTYDDNTNVTTTSLENAEA